MSPNVRRGIAVWLPVAVATTVMAGLVYGTVQQSYRTGADDPQLQMAEDAAARLSTGARPEDVTAGPNVDIATSLAPFTIVYGARGSVLASTGSLFGQAPTPPKGVLQAAVDGGTNSITWEPQDGVREAIVVIPWSAADGSGTVLAGRSLRAVEEREAWLTLMVGAALVVALVASAAAAFLFRPPERA
jgi:hypothetical protein